MAYNLKNLNISNFSYDKEVNHLTQFLKKHWDISAQPKGYTEFLKNYEDFKGMTNALEEKMTTEFTGHDGSGSISFPFPVKVSLPHVAYEATNQSTSPLENLIDSVMSYGMLLGMRLADTSTNTESYYRLTHLNHIQYMSYDEKDQQLQIIYIQEAGATTDLKIPLKDTINKYQNKRKAYLTPKTVKMLNEFFKEYHKRKLVITNKARSKNFISGMEGDELRLYDILYKLSLETSHPDGLSKYMKEYGFNLEFKQNVFYITRKKERKK